MPYENGIISIETTGGVTYGVSVYDIQRALVRGTGDVGLLCSDREWATVSGQPTLIRSYKTNKWAKYKPVKKAGLDFPNQRNANFTWKTKEQIEALGEIPWWKGTNGQCGLTFSTASNLGTQTIASSGFLHDLITTEPTWALAWGYDPPTGGISSYPYRMFDFLQYNAKAPQPVTGVYDNLVVMPDGTITVQLDENKTSNGTGIELSDLTISNSPVSGWYVGILIYKSPSKWAYAFSQNTLGGTGSLDVVFTGMTTYGGQNVKVVPFLSSVHWAQGGQETTGTFLSCDVEPQDVTIQIVQTGVTLQIYAEFGQGYGYVKSTVRIINNQTTQVQVRNLHIKLNDGTQDLYDQNKGNVTIVARDFVEYQYGRDWPITYDSSKRYKVVVTADSPSSANGEEPVNDPRQPNLT